MKAHIRQNTVPLLVGNFPTLKALLSVSDTCNTFNVGEIAFIEDEKKYYKYSAEKEWKEIDIELKNNGLEISLYELNKTAYSSLPEISKEDLEDGIQTINNFPKENENYFMLLCKEKSYYTLFKKENNITETFGEAVVDCLSYCGKVVVIENETDRIEIWVKDENNMANCYLLFNYDLGVVPYGG